MILLIDTSQETGIVALAKEGRVMFSEENKIAKEHAMWLHVATGRLLAEAKITMRELEAVAVVAGPGSYTGLRVGMAAAKGFCYALKIPLITQNTLRVMAESMRSFAEEKNAMICPMIDARRDEVFTALYQRGTRNAERLTLNAERGTLNAERLTLNAERETLNAERGTLNEERGTLNEERGTLNAERGTLNAEGETANGQLPTTYNLLEILSPQAVILDKNSFEMNLAQGLIVFFGTGAEKWKKIATSPNTIFEAQPNTIQAFATLVYQDFLVQNWADTVYSEPVYLKEFFTY
jgi:tRNA threonylcarbamoyl adenosine modification protein YeaZ